MSTLNHSEKKTSGYTLDEIKTKLNTYKEVEPEMWNFIPRGSHITYFRKNESDENYNLIERFRMGGFVLGVGINKCDEEFFYMSKDFVALDKIYIVKNNPKLHYTVMKKSIEKLYKRYDYFSFIEICTLSKKIDLLEERVNKFEKLISKK